MEEIEKPIEVKELQSLLNQVRLVVEKESKILDATGSRFNVYQMLGVNHYETVHSKIISTFLDPHGSHACGDKFLKAFLSCVGDAQDNSISAAYQAFECDAPTVRTEVSTDEGRLDILIKNDKYALIVENKVYAADGVEQLSRYKKFGDTLSCPCAILYLTLDGHDASEQSCRDIKYQPISYSDHILTWLSECAKIAFDKPGVRESIIQYKNHLYSLMGKGIEMTTENEIIKMLATVDNFATVERIHNSYAQMLNYIVNEVFMPKLADKLKEKEYTLNNKLGWHLNKYTLWEIACPLANGEKVIITFEFQSNWAKGLLFGIREHENSWEEKHKELRKKSQEAGGWGYNPWWIFNKHPVQYKDWRSAEYQMMLENPTLLIDEIIKCVEEVKAIVEQ